MSEPILKIPTKSGIDEISEVAKIITKEVTKEIHALSEEQIKLIRLQQDTINSLNERLQNVETLFFDLLGNEITSAQKIKLMQYGIKEKYLG